ncbi:barrier-to-autointegration factor-like protein isoform X2 [Ornithorhynchus anatinus]|uniref:Barrier-to-autointegration factor-like protein n=1 Tax=Ornithorhynchus anatinus TaxID=9258 RepID=A0A6I8NZA7_ORNAN|nr:barrier-to-autointegration factor-like protein isoform X2 [Ornithorhynchus anatinus]XP_039769125.1 barrier-to-autointegration factor-like protein isoform X2 [Ornithorhynchus anatinus]
MAHRKDTGSLTPKTPMKSEEMESTSEKQSTFESQPMGEKDITEVDGITTTLGEHLVAKGFDKAYILLGQFLLLHKNERTFQDWIMTKCGASPDEAQQSCRCLKNWCHSFL